MGDVRKPVVLAVCGLKEEARIAAGLGVATLACGGHASELARRLPQTIAELKPVGLISFGIAGGLDPKLATGDVVIGQEIIAGAERWTADAAWTAALRRALPRAVTGAIAGSASALSSAESKAALHAQTGARAVDMESQHVARAAKDYSLPFAALRIIADPAGRALPPAALAGLKPDGGANIPGVLWELLRAPAQLPALLKLASESKQALNALLGSRLLLGPGLGFPDFGKLLLDMA